MVFVHKRSYPLGSAFFQVLRCVDANLKEFLVLLDLIRTCDNATENRPMACH